MNAHGSSPTTPESSLARVLEPASRGGVRELVACFERLEAHDDATRQEIASLLGRDWPPRRVKIPAPAEATKFAQPSTPAPTRLEPPTTSAPAPAVEPEVLPMPLEQPSGAGGLLTLGEASPLVPELGWEPLPDQRQERPLLASLLRVKERRALYMAALETPRAGDRPDVSRILDALTTGRRLLELPMRSWPALTSGAQVMVDLASPMWGFFEDQEQVLQTLRPVVGPLLERLYFSGDPFEAGEGSSYEWKPYKLPSPGTPVLILSELGQLMGGEPARIGAQRWLKFARLLSLQDSPCIVLTPLRPRHFPQGLRRAVVLLEWDRATRVLGVRRARRAGGRHVDR